jgi:hypothetical protein
MLTIAPVLRLRPPVDGLDESEVGEDVRVEICPPTDVCTPEPLNRENLY